MTNWFIVMACPLTKTSNQQRIHTTQHPTHILMSGLYVCVKMEMILRLLMQFPYERAICQQHTYTTSLMVDFLYYIFIALAQKTIILREIYYFP